MDKSINSNVTSLGVSLPRVFGMSVGAAVLNLAAMWIGLNAGASLKTAAPEPINAFVVVMMTIVPLGIAGVIVWLLARRFNIRQTAAWAGLIFAIVTSAGSFLASADTQTALTLASMHVITGLAWFFALR